MAHKPDGSAVSWADFIAPLASSENQTLTLQPGVPQRDPNLAAFEQIDLAAGGLVSAAAAAEAIRQCGDAYNRARLTPTAKGIFHCLMALKS